MEKKCLSQNIEIKMNNQNTSKINSIRFSLFFLLFTINFFSTVLSKVNAFSLFSTRESWEAAVSGIKTEDFDNTVIQNSQTIGFPKTIETQFFCAGFSGRFHEVFLGQYTASIRPQTGSGCHGVSVIFDAQQFQPTEDVIAFGFDVNLLTENTIRMIGYFDDQPGVDSINLNEFFAESFIGVDGPFAENLGFIGVVTDQPIEEFTFVGFLGERSSIHLDNFSIAAEATPSAPVPEPLTILGTIAALGFGVLFKRK